MFLKTYEITQTERVLSCDEKVILGNKRENLVTKLKFVFSDTFEGEKYVALLNPETEKWHLTPMNNDSILVGSNVTQYAGVWKILVIVTNENLTSDNNVDLVTENAVYISNILKCVVRDNFLGNEFDSTIADPNVKLWYTEAMKLKAQLDYYLETDYYRGKDGKSAYELAVENGFTGTEEEWLAKNDVSDGVPVTEFVENGETLPPQTQEDFEIVEF